MKNALGSQKCTCKLSVVMSSAGRIGDGKDSGELVDHTFSNSMQSEANKTRKMLSCIKKVIQSRNKSIILPLYKTLVQHHIEYAVMFWSPILRKYVVELERVQQRVTCMSLEE